MVAAEAASFSSRRWGKERDEMFHTRYIATKDLFRALIRAKRSFKTDDLEDAPAPESREDPAPFTHREEICDDS